MIPPISRPISTGGSEIWKLSAAPCASDASSWVKASKSTSAARAAERIGDVAHVLGQVGHLRDAARVVGDRAERVEGDDQAGQRELRHHRDADAVDAERASARELPRAEDAERD